MEITAGFEQLAYDGTQENNITSSACSNIYIRQGRSAREVRVYMDDLSPALLGCDHIGKRHWVGLGHVAAHNQNTVAIDKVLWKSCGPATP